MNENTPGGAKFIIAYQCLITPEFEQNECTDNDETSTYKCENKKPTYLGD